MKQLLMPQILAAAMLLGMFHWTNYWDFVIYYVVTGGTVLFMNIICLKGDIRRILAVTIVQAIEIFAIATVIILPFTLQFDNHGTGCKIGTEPFPATSTSGPVGTSDDPDTCICRSRCIIEKLTKAGAQIPLPSDEGSPHAGSVCGDHGTVCDRTGC